MHICMDEVNLAIYTVQSFVMYLNFFTIRMGF